ncbi:ATP-binding protein [Bacillus massiliigorillae]|uniref:ATP-binding protein n=1 Tax=Bacillus massiliigorillae TaxID=1243664 RepID=UPI0005A5E15A|nr:sensor histidine kinase [Bacillus massiliigorillae]
MKRIPIHWKIIALTFFIIALSFLVAGIFIFNNIMETKESELSNRSMLMARTVAELPEIQQYLKEGEVASKQIDPIVERIRVINKADYIVVLNMDRVRLSHPISEMIGTKSKTADENASFFEHTYLSKAKGEVGTVVRAFVPIMDEQHEQVGVVIAGYVLPTMWEILMSLKKEILLTTMFSLFFGGWGAWALARHMKRQMFGLEPHEISRLYVERSETFNAMHEGIIAIDNNLVVTIFNNKAREILGVEGVNLVGKSIYDIVPDTRLPEILDYNYPIYNKELQINSRNILSNRIPIEVNDYTVGAVAIFQDRTEVKKLAEELTGVKAFVQALRIQNHEHKNKLHTIAGLIQLNHYDRALEYIFQVKEEQEELTKFLDQKIKNDHLSGLLLSKIGHGKELGITVEIDRNSKFTHFPKGLDQHDFVIILGNLINNAFDAVQATTIEDKKIAISIDQEDGLLSILVEDNGLGIPPNKIDTIFEQGYSTKQGMSRGIGLHLIYEIVKKGHGTIQVESALNEGTSFIITFDM